MCGADCGTAPNHSSLSHECPVTGVGDGVASQEFDHSVKVNLFF